MYDAISKRLRMSHVGSLMCRMKKIMLLIFWFPMLSLAEVDITTLDNWNIVNTSEHNLFITKQGVHNPKNFVGFQMNRPFCVCANPIFNLNTDYKLEEGNTVEASITVDMKKPTSILFRILKVFDSGNVFLRPLNFPSLRESRLVEVKSVLANELFLTSGIQHAMDSSQSMCESDYYFEYVGPKQTELDV